MGESIEYYSSSETSKLSKILLPIWRDIGVPEKLSTARKEAIKLLKQLTQQDILYGRAALTSSPSTTVAIGLNPNIIAIDTMSSARFRFLNND